MRISQLRELGEQAFALKTLTFEEYLEVQRAVERGKVDTRLVQQVLTNQISWPQFRRESLWLEEEVKSTFRYPDEYTGPKPLGQQIDILAGAFGLSLGTTTEFVDKVLPGLSLPDGAEGWFATPSIEAVAKRHFPEIKNPAEQYCRAVELVIRKLAGKRTILNYRYREGKLGIQYLQQHPHTLHMFEQITDKQKGDILVIAAQFGMRYRGRSIRRARVLFTGQEFGFGGFAVGCMALTHPERFVRWDQLHTDCPGDESDFEARGAWKGAPCWGFAGGLWIDAHRFDAPSQCDCSVSGFVPELQS